MIDWTQLTLFLFITMRMSGFILFNPILGRRTIPGLFRSGFILAFSVFAMSLAPGGIPIPKNIPALMAGLLLELGLGFLLGMAVNFFFYIPQSAGSIIDLQMGMTMNQIDDAGSQANMTANAVVPYGQAVFGEAPLTALLAIFVECTILGVKMCMPILAAELIAQMGMGILMKVIPQINVFSINIELKVIIGLLLLLMLTAPFSEFLRTAEQNMLDTLSDLLQLSAPA